ncbi:MAG: YkgJ family cysteine cluster protein [Deltaproteobacteria bacterium]|nr:YkgJ family cysteine cluster protein [Deltaproteobacteria bacterium]
MSQRSKLPEYVTRIDSATEFSFSCHKGVSCFTECCRLLELALTPYDILRLRQGTKMHSARLLEEFVIIEQGPGEPFPRFYLTMVDDGRASCAFVTKSGCSVYGDRPAACRTYPLGRAEESHCCGFDENRTQSISGYSRDQGLSDYNRFNDAIAPIQQHDKIRQGFIPSREQSELYTLALYNIDTFREKIVSKEIDSPPLTSQNREQLHDDEQLLLFAVKWLYDKLYPAP